jgi:hypothetical protein
MLIVYLPIFLFLTKRKWLSLCGCVPAGTIAKKELCDKDIRLIVDLFQRVKPQQIYAAGDLSDPHGTHRTCLKASVDKVCPCTIACKPVLCLKHARTGRNHAARPFRDTSPTGR